MMWADHKFWREEYLTDYENGGPTRQAVPEARDDTRDPTPVPISDYAFGLFGR